MNNEFKYAIVFAGQGAQKEGMGMSLYEASPAARAVFDRAGDGIKFDCFEADAERLRQTEVTQPAVYTMDMAAYAALREGLGIGTDFPEPSGTAGFSLGEYAAFTAAGIIDSIETGLQLVRKRSQLMKAAGTNADGSQRGTMAAGMGDPEGVLALVEKARGDDILEAVNFNSPTQTVVAGDSKAVERFAALAGEDRSFGVKAIPLPVSGAFHTPIMLPAAEGFEEFLEDFAFGEPAIPVFLNLTGDTYSEWVMEGQPAETQTATDRVKAIMVRQIKSPVQWQRTIEAMASSGIRAIIEVGPGKTLSGLARKTIPELVTLNVEDADSLEATIKACAQGI